MKNYSEYQKFVLKKSVIHGKQPTLRQRHGAYVLMTEVGELVDLFRADKFYNVPIESKMTSLVEELGDLYWGATELSIGLDLPMPGEVRPRLVYTGDYLNPMHFVNSLINVVARLFAQETSQESDKYILSDIFYFLDKICGCFGLTRGEVLEANMAKLNARYKEDFTEDEYNNRDTEEEMAQVECALEDGGDSDVN